MIFSIVLFLSYLLCLIAPRLGLLAYPGEHRKHNEPTPMVGGIAMFVGISIGIIMSAKSHVNIIPSMALLCCIGVLDDRYNLYSWLRIIAQIFAAYLMIELAGVQISSLGALFSEAEIELGTWSLPLTIFATIGVINALNMSDGLDGLAGSITILVLMSLFVISKQQPDFIAILIVAVSGFLFWNFRIFRNNAKLFMGDAGSTTLGLVVAYLLILSSQNPVNDIRPVTALWLLALPLFDAVGVLIIRLFRGQSPFSADRIHYHHLLQLRGYSVNSSLVLILLLQCLFITVGVFMLWTSVTETHQLLLFLLSFVIYLGIVIRETRHS